MADAAIACWDAKYEYNFWRPVTGHPRRGDATATPTPTADADLDAADRDAAVPGATPRATARSAGRRRRCWPASSAPTTSPSRCPSENPGVAARSFTSFSQAAEESAVSRLYGGIHFSFDNDVGVEKGTELGQFVFENFLEKDNPEAQTDLVDGVVVVYGTNGDDKIRVVAKGNRLKVKVNGGASSAAISGRMSPPSRWTACAATTTSRFSKSIQKDAILFGRGGNDVLDAAAGFTMMFGGGGMDQLFGKLDIDFFDGGAGLDLINGEPEM